MLTGSIVACSLRAVKQTNPRAYFRSVEICPMASCRIAMPGGIRVLTLVMPEPVFLLAGQPGLNVQARPQIHVRRDVASSPPGNRRPAGAAGGFLEADQDPCPRRLAGDAGEHVGIEVGQQQAGKVKPALCHPIPGRNAPVRCHAVSLAMP